MFTLCSSCVLDETDIEQGIQTCNMKERGGRGTEERFLPGQNKMTNLQDAAEQQCRRLLSLRLTKPHGTTFWY